MVKELLFILGLMVLNGVFVMAEIALVSSRKVRLGKMAKGGKKRAALALKIAGKPEYFLSTIQIFVSLISIIAAAYGGANIAEKFTAIYLKYPPLHHYAHPLGFATIVVITTYLAIVIGELVPKSLGINQPEKVSVAIAPFIQLMAWLAAPIRWVLQLSTKLILKILRVRKNTDPLVTEEELQHVIEQGSQHGILEKQESEMMRGIIRIGDRKVSSLMTHRSEIIWMDVNIPEEKLFETLRTSIHSSFPVCEGELDKIVGTVTIKDLFTQLADKKKFDIKQIMEKPLFFPETMPALELLETFKKTRTHTGLIVNEFGALEGIVTLHDIMESIVGDMPLESGDNEKEAVQRKDGSWLIDGTMQNDEWSELLKLSDITERDTGPYKTIGGFMMHHLGHIPKPADSFIFRNYDFEVVDMDSKRVDKVMVRKISEEPKEKEL